jgi:RNA recognition motif-containing protein
VIQIEEDDIRRKFSEFGVIKSLILKKKENYVTYSFIEYEKASEARAAIAE